MQLFYNDVAFHGLGVLRIGGQQFESQPDSTPHRMRCLLRVCIDVFQRSFQDNRNLVNVVREALKTQHGQLKWLDEVTENVFLDQTATVQSHNLPDEPNQWGSHQQSIEIVFAYYEQDLHPNGIDAIFKRSGQLDEVTLGHVTRTNQSYSASRYSNLRSHRSGASGRIGLTGQFLANPKAPLADRRAVLQAAKDEMIEQVNGADGQLKYGAFDKVVRVEDFSCDINDASDAIDWSLSATYTHFPNEAGYALAEFTITTRSQNPDGTTAVLLSGRVGAESLAAAKAKLATIRAALVASRAPDTLSAMTTSETDQEVHADTDGATFIELRFDDEYLLSKAAGALVSTLRMSDTEDVRSGFIRRTYSGTVLGKAATWATAYQAAVTKAKSLGAAKHQMLITGTVTANDNQQSSDNATSSSERFCPVEFNFEYQLKGSRVYMEVTSDISAETFGLNSETVSGYVVAANFATARTHYNTLKSGYGTVMFRNERTTESRQQIGLASGVPTGATRTPPNAGTWADVVNSGESIGINYARHEMRLDFQFSVHRQKASGGEVALRYSHLVRNDYLNRQRITRLQGSIWASSRADADWVLTQIASGGLGNLTESERLEDREKSFGVRASAADDAPSSGEYFLKLDFADTYQTRMANEDTILECEVTEDIEFSGARLVLRATAFGRDLVQVCGNQGGRRTVSGRVKAASETAAMEWARRQYHYPYGTIGMPAAPAVRYRQQPRLSVSPVFVPMDEGVARAGYSSYNPDSTPVKVPAWQVAFSFTELLTDFDYSE